ncbi:hypothetical protein ACOMHN_026779 [Nucella lapillus]
MTTHLEIVGSSASPRADLLRRIGLVDSRNGRMGSPSSIYLPSTPPSRRDARIIRIPSSRLRNTGSSPNGSNGRQDWDSSSDWEKFAKLTQSEAAISGSSDDGVVGGLVSVTTSYQGAEHRPQDILVPTGSATMAPADTELRLDASTSVGSSALCEQWLGLHKLPYPSPSPICGVAVRTLGKGRGACLKLPVGSVSTSHVPLSLGLSSGSVSGLSSSVRGSALHHDRPQHGQALAIRG